MSPVPYPGSYDSLLEQARKSKVEGIYLGALCPREDCSQKGPVRLTPWLVGRNAVIFDEAGGAVCQPSPVPLALCEGCKGRVRVLPAEFLPYKTFSLPVIETSCDLYLSCADGLRKTVKRIPGPDRPHYSSLHGWLGGMGERVLDRVRLRQDRAAAREPSLPPTSVLVGETAKRRDPQMLRRWNKTSARVAPSKYKSLFRKERLEACFKLLVVASSLFVASAYPLTQWELLVVEWFHVPGWLFRSRQLCTAIQLSEYTKDLVQDSLANKHFPRGPP